MLGANFGSAINPLIEGGIHGNPASRRLPLGNLINRLVGILIVLPFLPTLARELSMFQPDAAKMTAEFHLLFNVALAAIFIGLLDPRRGAIGARPAGEEANRKMPLCRVILTRRHWKTLPLALANAARETLRMGDTVEVMLRDVMAALMNNDRALVSQASRLDNVVDRLNEAIKLYITKLTRDSAG